MWGWIVWRLAPSHSYLVLDIGHIGGYILDRTKVRFWQYLPLCKFVSKYCLSKKILIRFYCKNNCINVIVDEGVFVMNEYKEKLIKLLEILTVRQVEYLYHLASRLFGQTVD